MNIVLKGENRTYLGVSVWSERHGVPYGHILSQQFLGDVSAHGVKDEACTTRVSLGEIRHV